VRKFFPEPSQGRPGSHNEVKRVWTIKTELASCIRRWGTLIHQGKAKGWNENLAQTHERKNAQHEREVRFSGEVYQRWAGDRTSQGEMSGDSTGAGVIKKETVGLMLTLSKGRGKS